MPIKFLTIQLFGLFILPILVEKIGGLQLAFRLKQAGLPSRNVMGLLAAALK
jgi:hypothetical protein